MAVVEVSGLVFGGAGGIPVPAGLTDGSVIFAAAGTLSQDNANFFWNNTTKKLIFGNAATLGWSDIGIARDGAQVLALKDGVNPYTLRIYGGAAKLLSLSNDNTNSRVTDFGGNLILGAGNSDLWVLNGASGELAPTGSFNFGSSAKPINLGFINFLTVANAGALVATSVALTNGAGASAGTLTNAPSIGNPTKWIPISDNGTIRNIPAW